MSKPTLSTLRAAAKKIGATVDETSIDYGVINVDAPNGMQWGASGTHALNVHWHVAHDATRPTWPEEKTEAIKDCLERMEHGFSKCDCEECQES